MKMRWWLRSILWAVAGLGVGAVVGVLSPYKRSVGFSPRAERAERQVRADTGAKAAERAKWPAAVGAGLGGLAGALGGERRGRKHE